MKIFSKFLALTLAIFALSFVHVNAQSFSGDNKQSGRTLEQQIFKKLISLPYYGVFDHIAYQGDGNTVVLSGKVLSLGTRKQAERTVAGIPGVERVVNNIQDLPPSPYDNQIRRQLVREFANSAGLYMYLREPNPSVRIVVENGRVTLEGYGNNRGTSNTMNILANGVPGVFSVTNNLLIEKEVGR
jgi:hyperosmotically inducible protein